MEWIINIIRGIRYIGREAGVTFVEPSQTSIKSFDITIL
ncbi:LacX 2 domain protein [Streptococcus pneumoniae GA19101]|nr:LacX 2 domain protein [Streptococcus pneumoniae GA07228]EHE72565.1 LacX 2 domain protein [Streptococcus pneumoniae GA19690]EHZ36029.1 LacX 2 domain protein [Streptococcus pneumoniae GA19101]EHZ66143.1 LacX 2 domain protein [Streptococcus pneumoniae GA47597]